MKTPEEIFKLLRSQTECGLYEPGTQCQQCDDEAKRMLDIALDIQAEAWNEAIKTASENARVKPIYDAYNFQTGGHYTVDRDSILKLMK